MVVLAGRYGLLEQVGEGGMGVVWRARDVKLGRDVAVKLLRPFVAGEPGQRRRFEREARMLAGLANDHIVRVFDYVDDGEQAFLVMEFVDGGNLAEATFGRLPLSAAEAAGYAAPVAAALAYAHGRGVVHRDLTPANILVERESGRVVTTDFGLARIARSAGSLTTIGVLIGTPEYWSPEQAMGRESGVAADMYAFGCILFLLLSGRLPFEGGDDRLALGLRRAHEDAPSLGDTVPGLSPAVAVLVDSLLAREPARRPTAAAAAVVLSGFASTQVRPVGPPLPAEAAVARTAVLPGPWLASTPRNGTHAPISSVERPPASPTVAGPSAAPATVASAPPPLASPAAVSGRSRKRPSRRLVAASVAVASAAATVGVLFLVAELREQTPRVPNVVALRESLARRDVLRRLPNATVSVTRAYSTRIAAGRVIRQTPKPRAPLQNDRQVRLVVSKGTPFAAVPEIAAGAPAATARATLVQSGFGGRYRYTPSWTVRKGTVIDLYPTTGTRLRRPATVKILVASGYPREVVPDLRNSDLASAQTRLAAKHLNYRVVYRLTHSERPNQVLGQIPPAGATVYKGTSVRLAVSRTLRWVKLLAQTGADPYESDPFTVPEHWRIRYRLAPGEFGPAFAQFSWSRDGNPFGNGGFFANTSGTRTYAVSNGAGTFRLAVNPYAGTAWYVEVDALQ